MLRDLDPDALVPNGRAVDDYTGRSDRTRSRMIAAGEFPKPIMIRGRKHWRFGWLKAWNDAQAAQMQDA